MDIGKIGVHGLKFARTIDKRDYGQLIAVVDLYEAKAWRAAAGSAWGLF
jgi:hypothetical protein